MQIYCNSPAIKIIFAILQDHFSVLPKSEGHRALTKQFCRVKKCSGKPTIASVFIYIYIIMFINIYMYIDIITVIIHIALSHYNNIFSNKH